MKINIHYYKSNSGRMFVKEYIESLDKETKYGIYAFLKKFKLDNHYRQIPYCKKITKEIFEIRIKIKDSYRILYASIYKNNVMLLHIFKKKTRKTPKKDLNLAINRLKTYEG